MSTCPKCNGSNLDESVRNSDQVKGKIRTRYECLDCRHSEIVEVDK